MRYNPNKNFGLTGIIEGTTESEAELMERAKKEVMKKIGVTKWVNEDKQPSSLDELDLYTTIPIPKPVAPKPEIKDEYGFTPKQNKEIENWLTRPATNKEKEVDPIKKMVRKNMPILTYIDKVSNLYDGKPRKYNDQGKLLKPEQHPQDTYYEDEIKRIEKKGTSWAAKHFKKQNEQAEVARIGKLVDKAAAKPENKKWEYKSRIDELASADKITDQLTKLKDFGNSTNPHLNTKKTPS